MRRLVLVVLLLGGVLTPIPPAVAAPAGRLAVGAVTDIAPGVRAGDRGLARDALRGVTGERFYFVLPDRFANGDPGNDRGRSGDTDRLLTGFDPSDKGFYHGGDLKGLHGELDYLDGLGITAIWLTPVFRNRWVQGLGTDVSAGYHGYWATDYTKLDPHFGTTNDMRRLIRDAHRRGIKVFFDIVANHTADLIDYAEGRHDYVSTGAVPYLDPSGKPVDIAAIAGRKDFPKLTAPYTPVVRGRKEPLWLNDPSLYHNRGDSTFTGESDQYGDFFGLDDLMTEHPTVVAGMKRIFTSWIDALGIDGYRVDTVKHVNIEFWQALAPHVKRYAEQRGKKDFFVFGEVLDSDPADTSRYTTTGKMQAVLDFPFQSGAATFLSGRGAARLGEVLVDDDRYTDADSNAASLPTFLGNHDLGRFAWTLRQNRPGITEPELLDRVELGNALMYLWRGNPVVYYGDEQGFAGTGGDKAARQDLFASATPEYRAEDLIGSDRTGAVDNHTTDHPLYRQLRDLAAFVDSDPVWREGNQTLRLSSGDVVAFSRVGAAQQVEHLVVANAGTSPASVDVPVDSAALRPVWPVAGAEVRAVDGKVSVTVPPLSALVFKGTGRLPAVAPTPVVVAPPVGTVLDDRVELRADGITSPFAQATFAARVDGEDWTVLGTDDAAPYRVFADIKALPGAAVGKNVEIRVVAKDSTGTLGADGVTLALTAAPDVDPPGTVSPDWLVVHYNRPAGDYEGWGLHVWGDVVDAPTWERPLPFVGETPYGRFAWVRVKPGARQVGILVHRGDEKDTSADRFADPSATPQVWLQQGQAPLCANEIAATGQAVVHHTGDTSGLVVRSGATDVLFDGGVARIPATAPVEFSVQRNGNVEASGRTGGHAWVNPGSAQVFTSLAAAQHRAVIHYHRPDGDYPDWSLYHWTGSLEPSPGWNQSRPPDGSDGFGAYWAVPLAASATGLAHIIHRGDTKDPAADQFLDLNGTGHEVWFVSGSTRPDGSASYVLPPSG
ncbi:alpha-amylase family glycosyl hydrolase [Actinosynnema sp. NPDC047251]|uniref:Alpha-1,6-glucosidase, pullulanase-type n=1 Tax=Saccharothrix espanaensis (strain ATCC 51144 / DSM 44229 / JCM 9112 / NBRC 15066 / NRRL 15764) TaxID=1179773 RepID=K0JVC5_SACES|nr:alpha-amylase family glycosyl hydrolase [Saccharothrix espanaensis]CCH28734.1 alpha-1,6-glucosidase, pullulanase-type [Saccharothrix espanaensis DSM 44229]